METDFGLVQWAIALQVAALVVLVLVTIWYAVQTHRLANLAESQLEYIAEERQAGRYELGALLNRISVWVTLLPEEMSPEEIFESQRLDPLILNRVQTLASQHSHQVSEDTRSVIYHVGELLDLAEKVWREAKIMSYRPSERDRERWRMAWKGVRAGLSELTHEVESVP